MFPNFDATKVRARQRTPYPRAEIKKKELQWVTVGYAYTLNDSTDFSLLAHTIILGV